MSGPSTDRYDLPVGPGGKDVETQVLVSARDLNPVSVPSGWVNQHLQYTHGYGAVVAPANQVGVDLSDGDPNFTLANVPPQGQPSLSGPAAQPRIYFDDEAQSMSGYVIANSGQPELDYENASANETYSSYSGKGGVPVGGLLRRAAFALSMGDLNILISSSVTAQSRVIYYRNVVERLQKVAPFLSYDSDPYPVIIDGGIYWVVDAYTTTDNFPYSEQADTTSDLPTSSGLYGQSLNYVSNSVKAVVSAYSGQMWLFVQQPNDPIIETYEHAFPKLFTPMSEANSIIPGITSHWRYPEDLFTVQAEIYARYHQTKVPVFYNNAQQWGLAQNPVSGEVGTTTTTGGLSGLTQASGAISEQSVMPIYELMALPGQDQQSFVLVEPFVPQAAGASRQNLTALLTASSDPTDYGQLTVFTTPPNQTVDGPALVSTAVQENPTISKAISLLNTGGSVVVLGDVVTVPVGQTLLYVQPLYVEQATNALARLEYVIVVYNGTAYMSSNASLDNALCQVVNTDGSHPFGSYCSTAAAKASSVTSAPTGKGGSTTTTTTTVPSTSTTSAASSTTSSTVALPTQHGTVAQLLAAAEQDFADANAALRQGDLATYQADIAAAEALVEEAAAKSAGSPTGTTTVP
jgi:uncharacterized membrane protein (UPF0182 family)